MSGITLGTYGDPNWRNLPHIADDRFMFMDTSQPAQPGKLTVCLMCAKPFIMPNFIGHADQICGECRKTYADAAILVCRHCRVTICRIAPKVLDNGFYIRPRSILHTDKCNVCAPGLMVSTILEIAEWMQNTRQAKPVIIVPPGFKSS